MNIFDCKPIIFNAEMLQAAREGRKTVTRRLVKGYALEHLRVDVDGSVIGVYQQDEGSVFPAVSFAPYQPGDVLYAPEPWRALCSWKKGPLTAPRYGCAVKFRDGEEKEFYFENAKRAEKWEKYLEKQKDEWKSPYFMPREAARLFFRATGVRVERLQNITEEQATAEGGRFKFWISMSSDKCAPPPKTAVEDFSQIWDRTVKPRERDLYGWAANPWVWVIEFERMRSLEEAGEPAGQYAAEGALKSAT